MIMLAIDTSTDQASVALLDDSVVRAEYSWWAKGNHSQLLDPAIKEILRITSTPVHALSAITVAIGPGSFSGLRVGLSEAKGLALGLAVPLVGVGTLDLIGYQAAGLGDRIIAVLPAGRGQVFVAEFHGAGARGERIGDYRVLSVEKVLDLAGPDALVTGEAAPLIAEAAEERGITISMEPPSWHLRRSGHLAELGVQYLARGGRDQAESMEPLYLRRSAAEEKRSPESLE